MSVTFGINIDSGIKVKGVLGLQIRSENDFSTYSHF